MIKCTRAAATFTKKVTCIKGHGVHKDYFWTLQLQVEALLNRSRFWNCVKHIRVLDLLILRGDFRDLFGDFVAQKQPSI